MKVQWIRQYAGIGSALGYTTLEQNLIRALIAAGVEFAESEIAVHLLPTHYFTAMRFKQNVLFTMSEFDIIPPTWSTRVNAADLVIVPCEHNVRIYEDASYGPAVELCPLGVDVKTYACCDRDPAPEVFTFLYVGDFNARKGTYHIAKAWEEWNNRYPERREKTQLIMKMTAPGHVQELNQVTCNSFCDWRILPTVADGGDLPTLAGLYRSAHCFLFPTMGEGFGLTLAEAMCTGLPCIYTPWSGPADIAGPGVAYPIDYTFKDVELIDPVFGTTDHVQCAGPVIGSIVDRMDEIYSNYEGALEKGLHAAAHIYHRFPWEKAAHRFIDIIEKHFGRLAD